MSNTYIEKVVTWRHGENTLYAGTPVDDNARPANNENAIGVVAEDLNHPNKTARVLIAGEWDEDLYRGHIVLRNRAKRAMKDITFRHPAIPNDKKVTNLTDDADLVFNNVVDVVGIPTYVDDVTDYPEYSLAETGWYVFSRILARGNDQVTAETTVEGAAGYIATVGNDYIDVAVRFGVTAMSQKVVIKWSAVEDTYVFKATDLAIRNLDYRTTFYIYDLAPFVTWEYALTSDTEFAADKTYYTLVGGEYVEAEVTAGEAVAENTYYNHSKLRIAGMVRNVTYRLNEMVDAPIEIVLPVVPDDGYGAWFEIQMQFNSGHSVTLLPEDSTVKVGTTSTQAQTAGINVIDLQYADVNGEKIWTLLNTHTNLPTVQEGSEGM